MAISPLTGGIDPVAGHGTFISGLVHQMCPDAVVLACRLYGGEGFISEWELLRSLRRLLLFHVMGLEGRKGCYPVDVLSLSLGYRHERPEDAAFDTPFRALLDRLRRTGVAVVVSSGNDGDPRPVYPAAFAPYLDRSTTPPRPIPPSTLDPADPPLLSVGALNPDGSTALFSNDGPWVTCRRPGAGLVSTFPTTLEGSRTRSTELAGTDRGERRGTMAPEGFGGGFGVWSGTSFAAPVLAGELAAVLLEQREGGRPAERGADPATLHTRCEETWAAITATTGLVPTT
jgi:subtilisin family serine protease